MRPFLNLRCNIKDFENENELQEIKKLKMDSSSTKEKREAFSGDKSVINDENPQIIEKIFLEAVLTKSIHILNRENLKELNDKTLWRSGWL